MSRTGQSVFPPVDLSGEAFPTGEHGGGDVPKAPADRESWWSGETFESALLGSSEESRERVDRDPHGASRGDASFDESAFPDAGAFAFASANAFPGDGRSNGGFRPVASFAEGDDVAFSTGGADDARVDALLERETEHGVHDREAVRAFVGGNRVVNSDALGPLDASHVKGASRIFARFLAEAHESAATGEPVDGTMSNGSSRFTRLSAAYEIHLPQGASEERQIEVAREMTLSFLYGYERNSTVLGGLGNRAAQLAGLGPSAFSTEDLVSNAAGVFHAETLAREKGVEGLLALPTKAVQDHALKGTALDAGNILSIGPDTVTSFGNEGYLPKYRHGHEQPLDSRQDNETYRYLVRRQAEYESTGDFAPQRGEGWRLNLPPEPVVPHEGTLWEPTGG